MIEKILIRICLYSIYTINYTILLYILIYVCFRLFEKSVVYNYLAMFCLGLYLGSAFVDFSYQYLRRKNAKDIEKSDHL